MSPTKSTRQQLVKVAQVPGLYRHSLSQRYYGIKKVSGKRKERSLDTNQEDVIAIPKAGRPESRKANLEALTISLDDEDRAAIAALPKNQRFVRPPFAPEWDAVA